MAIGTVTFSDGGAVIAGPIAVNGNGVAAFSTSTLSEGIHNLSAAYSDSSNTYFPGSGSLSIEIDTPTSIPSAGEYCNGGGLSIAGPNGTNNTQATPYPSRINVTGLAGTLKSLVVFFPTVLLSNPAASAMALTGPNNSNIKVFWNDAGGAVQIPLTPPNPFCCRMVLLLYRRMRRSPEYLHAHIVHRQYHFPDARPPSV